MAIDRKSLSRLFSPTSIAVYGASGDLQKIGGRALRYLRMMDFPGAVYPINPGRKTVQDLQAFPTAASIPGEVDLAIIVVPAEATIPALEDCAKKGVGSALVISSGFAEIGGEGVVVQKRMAELARQSGMRLLGPNCLGFVNSAHRLSATFSPSRELCWPGPGPVGFASQSGAFASLCAAVMHDRGMGLGTWITTGNEADVDLADAIAFLAEDASVKVIAAYMEGCRNAAKLSEAFEAARDAGKPVFILKVGRTEVGAAAVASHTASMAGRDELFDAYFRAHGVVRVNSVEELLDSAYVCAYAPKPPGRRTVIVSTSGGVGVLMGDSAIEAGLNLDPLPETAQAQIKAILPFAGTRNPVDTTAQIIADMRVFNQCFEVVIEGAKADIIFAHLSLLGYDDQMMGLISNPLCQLRSRYPEKLFVVSMLCSPARRKEFEDAGFLVFSDPSRAINSVARACRVRELLVGARPAPSSRRRARVTGLETEAAAKRFVAASGIPVPQEKLATSPEEAALIAENIGGKVVMKIVSPDIKHKTEVGGVVLGIEGGDAANHAYTSLVAKVRKQAPNAEIQGVLVGQQIEGGFETIAGMVNDPVLGPFVMFGLGGIYAEVVKDVVFRPAPFDKTTGLGMINELRAAAVLKGARGQASGDLESLADALSRLSSLAAEGREWLDSIDINPLIVRPDGVFAVDALVVSN